MCVFLCEKLLWALTTDEWVIIFHICNSQRNIWLNSQWKSFRTWGIKIPRQTVFHSLLSQHRTLRVQDWTAQHCSLVPSLEQVLWPCCSKGCLLEMARRQEEGPIAPYCAECLPSGNLNTARILWEVQRFNSLISTTKRSKETQSKIHCFKPYFW